MPYIKKEDRPQYSAFIEEVVGTITTQDELDQVELVGWFCRTFVNTLRGVEQQVAPIDPKGDFIEVSVDMEIARKIAQRAKIVAGVVKSNHSWHRETLKILGTVNYVLSAVAWGVAEDASYGMRSAIKSVLMYVRDYLAETKQVNKRRSVLLTGVVDDVILEMYRRQTAVYEDKKMQESGDIWPLPSQ